MTEDRRVRPAEAHANVFKLAQLGLVFLNTRRPEDLTTEQKTLLTAGTRSLMYFDRQRREAERMTGTCCSHCGKQDFRPRDDYMVRESVWRQAHPEGFKGLLHLHCLQERLGRLLKVDDFSYNMCFLNRHLYSISFDEWAQRTGVPTTPGMLAKVARQNRNATDADHAYVEAIRDRA